MIRAVLVALVALLVWAGAWNLAFRHLTDTQEVLIGLPFGMVAGVLVLAWWDGPGEGSLW